MKRIRVLIAESQPILQAGLDGILQQSRNLHIVGLASDGEEAVRLALQHRPEIMLLNIAIAGLTGVEVCQLVGEHLPYTRVLILSENPQDERLFAAIRVGASGILLESIRAAELQLIVEAAGHNELAFDLPLLRFRRSLLLADLSAQERRVLELLGHGLSNREIAEQLCLSLGTARNHVSEVLSRLHVQTRAQAAALAVRYPIGSER